VQEDAWFLFTSFENLFVQSHQREFKIAELALKISSEKSMKLPASFLLYW
jgi:hypothetical protein